MKKTNCSSQKQSLFWNGLFVQNQEASGRSDQEIPLRSVPRLTGSRTPDVCPPWFYPTSQFGVNSDLSRCFVQTSRSRGRRIPRALCLVSQLSSSSGMAEEWKTADSTEEPLKVIQRHEILTEKGQKVCFSPKQRQLELGDIQSFCSGGWMNTDCYLHFACARHLFILFYFFAFCIDSIHLHLLNINYITGIYII